jgi:drug/metabolite transporter (DMT)-like permease
VPPLEATVAVAQLTAAIYLPIYLAFLPKRVEAASWSAIALQATFQGVIATIVQMVLYIRTVALIGPTRLGMLMGLVPPLAALLAVPSLHEPLTPAVLAGLGFTVAGTLVGNRSKWIGRQRSESCLT